MSENNVPVRRHRNFEIAISPDRNKIMRIRVTKGKRTGWKLVGVKFRSKYLNKLLFRGFSGRKSITCGHFMDEKYGETTARAKPKMFVTV